MTEIVSGLQPSIDTCCCGCMTRTAAAQVYVSKAATPAACSPQCTRGTACSFGVPRVIFPVQPFGDNLNDDRVLLSCTPYILYALESTCTASLPFKSEN